MYCIVVKKYFPQIHNEFFKQLNNLKREGFLFKLSKYIEGKWVCFQCFDNEIGKKDDLENQIADILANYIVDELIYHLLKNCIKKCYYYFGKDDREQIFKYAKEKISKGLMEDDLLRIEIKKECLKFLVEFNYINIDGFIKFKMKYLTEKLHGIVDDSVSNLLSDKEYNEFIGLLKHFVTLQKPKIELIHVTINEDKEKLEFRDYYYELLNPVSLGDLSLEISDNEIEYEEVLMSTLIILAPKRIVIHKNVLLFCPQALNTLEYIFEGRIKICSHCKLCKSQDIKLRDK